MRFRIQQACLLCCCCFFFPGWCRGVGGAAEGTEPVFRGLRRRLPAVAGPVLVVVFCLLRLSRCFSRSAVCLLCPRVFYCFLLFCALLLLFCFFFFLFFSFFNSRAAAIARLFVATVSVTRQSYFVGGVFCLSGQRANAEASHCLLSAAWQRSTFRSGLSHVFFLFYFFFCFCVTARDAADCVIV